MLRPADRLAVALLLVVFADRLQLMEDGAWAVARPAAAHHVHAHRHLRRLHQDAHQVVRALPEKRVRIDDVVQLAPLAPLPGKRAQRVGLAGAREPVPEDELPTVRGLEVAHDRVEARTRPSGVVAADLVPFGDCNRAQGRHRSVRRVRPERDRHVVARDRLRCGEQLTQAFEHRGRRRSVRCREAHMDVAAVQAHNDECTVAIHDRGLASLAGRVEQGRAEAVDRALRGRPGLLAQLCELRREDAGEEEGRCRLLAVVETLRDAEMSAEIRHAFTIVPPTLGRFG